ncbi:hypothetical protein Ciccas_003078 [Cichlidogyrus casuarinus]|uniref:Uncharacterized protein n=1 Tax=Cichlidogyrus casuarinus TaxID=1844966 RepID=A0ABD2QFD9_9PLAT
MKEDSFQQNQPDYPNCKLQSLSAEADAADLTKNGHIPSHTISNKAGSYSTVYQQHRPQNYVFSSASKQASAPYINSDASLSREERLELMEAKHRMLLEQVASCHNLLKKSNYATRLRKYEEPQRSPTYCNERTFVPISSQETAHYANSPGYRDEYFQLKDAVTLPRESNSRKIPSESSSIVYPSPLAFNRLSTELKNGALNNIQESNIDQEETIFAVSVTQENCTSPIGPEDFEVQALMSKMKASRKDNSTFSLDYNYGENLLDGSDTYSFVNQFKRRYSNITARDPYTSSFSSSLRSPKNPIKIRHLKSTPNMNGQNHYFMRELQEPPNSQHSSILTLGANLDFSKQAFSMGTAS